MAAIQPLQPRGMFLRSGRVNPVDYYSCKQADRQTGAVTQQASLPVSVIMRYIVHSKIHMLTSYRTLSS